MVTKKHKGKSNFLALDYLFLEEIYFYFYDTRKEINCKLVAPLTIEAGAINWNFLQQIRVEISFFTSKYILTLALFSILKRSDSKTNLISWIDNHLNNFDIFN